jgi:hypothetical protein
MRIHVRHPEPLGEPIGEVLPSEQRFRKDVEEQATLDVQLGKAADSRARAGALEILQAAGFRRRGKQRVGGVQRGAGGTARERLESNRLAGRSVQDRLEKRVDLLPIDQCADIARHPHRLGNVTFLTL